MCLADRWYEASFAVALWGIAQSVYILLQREEVSKPANGFVPSLPYWVQKSVRWVFGRANDLIQARRSLYFCRFLSALCMCKKMIQVTKSVALNAWFESCQYWIISNVKQYLFDQAPVQLETLMIENRAGPLSRAIWDSGIRFAWVPVYANNIAIVSWLSLISPHEKQFGS